MGKNHKYSKAIAGIILAILVIISTGGIMVFEHHCACSQKITTHLIPIDHSCCHNNSSVVSCCSGHEDTTSCPAEQDRKCCQTIPVYLKIYTPFETGVVKQFSRASEIQPLLVFTLLFSDALQATQDHTSGATANAPPIKPFKRIISFHQLKIAPPEYSI